MAQDLLMSVDSHIIEGMAEPNEDKVENGIDADKKEGADLREGDVKVLHHPLTCSVRLKKWIQK